MDNVARKQAAIEREAGIDDTVAQFMMNSSKPCAKQAMDLLLMACARYEQGVAALLKCAVDDCRKEMQHEQ